MKALRILLLSAVSFFTVVDCVAQDYYLSQDIESKLRSRDPRRVADGASSATFARDEAAFTMMMQMVERWDPWQRHRFQNGERYDAMLAVLDSLIQSKQVVPSAGVTAISNAFPEQALILVSRLPFEQAEPILLNWFNEGYGVSRFREEREGEDRPLLARVAAMMLASKRSQSFAASILGDSQERLVVSVVNDQSAGIKRCFYACQPTPACDETITAGTLVDPPLEGWPVLYQYDLEDNKTAQPKGPEDDGLVVEAGGDRITYRRTVAGVHLAHCFPLRPLNAETRYHLLVELLGETPVPWPVQKDATVYWSGNSDYLQRLSLRILQEEQTLWASARAFFEKGLIDKGQLASIRPRLAVIVFDDRLHTSVPFEALPPPLIEDSRTTIRVRQ